MYTCVKKKRDIECVREENERRRRNTLRAMYHSNMKLYVRDNVFEAADYRLVREAAMKKFRERRRSYRALFQSHATDLEQQHLARAKEMEKQNLKMMSQVYDPIVEVSFSHS